MSNTCKSRHTRPGFHHPLGATVVGTGTNFAVYSKYATGIDICLYDGSSGEPSDVIPLQERTSFVWHGLIQDVPPGTRYGIRAHGPYQPLSGHRFNPSKLLVDPYARAIDGAIDWNPSVYGYELGDDADELEANTATDDEFMPKSVVMKSEFDWAGDSPPTIPWAETVIYEAHVKGLTKLHPDVPEALRGSYAGACHPSVIQHLHRIGVTSIELLPVHSHADDAFLAAKGLTNYWGYSTLGFFSPHAAYASVAGGGEVDEFKAMVKTFHEAGIEVLLDVVYNHTAEGNHHGPTLSFRGLDNHTYYHGLPEKPEYYLDFTGTGNSLRAAHPQVITLILDSLRYWVSETHVDGFRFDLATTLGRDEYEFDPWSGLLDAIHQDPVLAHTKLIAEPWDIGEGGYQLGNFPVGWSEWNDRFRDSARAFWLHGSNDIAELAYRLTGSSDVFEPSGRGPTSSVNLITTHDGFTLSDLVSYEKKHNEANGENGNDGHDHNLSTNLGHEGPTDNQDILAMRGRMQRNLLATLMLSQGVPMVLAGDEFGRTQQGNNNAYCQDNEISWLDWASVDDHLDLTAFVARLAAIRAANPILRRRRFFDGRPSRPEGFDDISWFRADGQRLTAEDWAAGASTLGLRMAGDSIGEVGDQGEPIVNDTLMLIVHAGDTPTPVVLPAINREEGAHTWEVILDTDDATGASRQRCDELTELIVPANSLLLLAGRPEPQLD